MKKILLSFVVFFLLTGSCSAANWYVRPGGAGAYSGIDWNNASDIGGAHNIPWSSVKPGDTIWLAGGVYTNALAPAAGGTSSSHILIRRVLSTDAVPVAAPGWNSAYDSQVVISTSNGIQWISGNDQQGSYVTVDGRIDSGIRSYLATDNGGAAVLLNTAVTGVTLQYIDIAGPAGSTPYNWKNDSSGLWINIAYGHGTLTSNINVNHCRIHGAANLVKLNAYNSTVESISDTVIEYCMLYDNLSSNLTAHENVLASCPGPIGTNIFRYNDISNWDVEGIMIGDVTGTPPQTWEIYGNVFHDGYPSSYARAVEVEYAAHTVYFYNNTLVNLWVGLRSSNGTGASFAAGSEARNNIYWNLWGAPTDSTFPNGDYDFMQISNTEAHGIGGGSNPFVNYDQQNYQIVGTIGIAYPRGKGEPLPGLALPSLFSTDILGNAYSNSPSMGAYEWTGAPPAPPNGLRLID